MSAYGRLRGSIWTLVPGDMPARERAYVCSEGSMAGRLRGVGEKQGVTGIRSRAYVDFIPIIPHVGVGESAQWSVAKTGVIILIKS